jgi:predicted small secreted protein
MFRNILIALTVGTMALAASACNTVRGLGHDVQSVANAGDRAI